MKKRIISIVLAVLMVVSLLPVTASAATTRTASGGTKLQTIIDNASSGDTIKLTGDYICNNASTDSGGDESYIVIKKTLTIDLNGHTISAGNKGRRVISVSATGPGNLTIIDSVGGGKITGGSVKKGGGVYLGEKATFTMKGGSITGNTTENDGSAIYVSYGAKANIYGGEICNNKTLTTSGERPIIIQSTSSSGKTAGTLSLGGTVKIYGNRKSNGDLRNLGAGSTVKIVGSGADALKEGAEIWLNDGSFKNDQQITGTVAGYLTPSTYQYFFADPDFSVIRKTDGNYYAHKHNNWTYTASGATLTANCKTCSYTVPLTVTAPANANYDGKDHANASLDTSAVEKWNRIVNGTGGVAAPSITYTNSAESSVSQAINGGTYYANIKAGNTTAKAAFTVNRIAPTAAKLSYTAPGSLTYDGNDHAPTFTAASGVTGLGNISVDYYLLNGEKVESAKMPGEYTVYAKVDDTGCNYTAKTGLTDASWKFTIVKNTSPVTINAKGENFTYGDANKTGFTELSVAEHEDFDLSGLIKTYYKETTTGEYESTGSTTVPTDVGNYKVVISVPDTDIHYEGSTSVTFSITPKALTEADVEAISDVAYTGSELKPTVVVKDGEKPLAEGTDYTVAYTDNTEVGTATATITLCGNYTGTINKSFAITKATPTIPTAPTAGEITYGQTLADSDLSDGAGSVCGTFAWTTNSIAPAVSDSEKTEYEVTFTPNDTAHYNTVICKVKVKVNKADYTGVANTASGNLNAKSGSTVEITLPTIPTGASYGTAVKTTEANKYTLSAISDGKIMATSTGITAEGDMTFTVPVTPDGNHIGYTIIVTITPKFHTHSFTYAADGNQIIATCGNTETDCNLDGRTITLTLTAEDSIYNGSAYSGASHDDSTVNFASTTGATVGNIEYYKGTEKLDAAPVDAGSYTAKLTVTYDTDKTVTAEKEFKINKASPTVAQFDFTAPESTSLTYDGNGKTATVTFNDNGGKLSGMGSFKVKYQKSGESTWSVNAPKNAGTYKVAIDVAEGDDYTSVSDLTTDGWKFTITKATPAADDFIFAAPESLTYDGQEKSAAFAASEGIIGMGEITVKYQKTGESTWSDTAPVNAGTYKVKINVAEGDNYTAASSLTAEDWTFVIAKATPTASNFAFNAPENLTYDGNGKTATVTFKDDDGVLSGMGSITVYYQKNGENTWSETAPTAVGTYKVAIGVAEGNNYAATSSVLTVDGWTFTITKAAQIITADAEQSFVFGDTGKSVIVALTTGDGALNYSVKSGDSVTVDASSGALTISKIGDTVITITAAETDNYNSASKDITVKIGAKAIAKPTAVDKTYTYTGEKQSFELNGFDANTMTISGNKQTAANETGYTVTVTPQSNYVWTTEGDCTFTWVIGKASVAVPAANTETFTYTGEDQSYFTLTGEELYAVAFGDGFSAATQKNAGTYTIKLSLKDAGNYKWTSGTGDPTYTFAIAKAVYSGTKTASGDLKAKANSTMTVDLPALPTGAGYAANGTGFNYGTAAVAGGKLTLTVGASGIPAETAAFDVTVAVTGAKNYEDYFVTVEVTPVYHTHSFTYAANGAVLTATCTEGCTDGYDTTPITLTLTAADSIYNGNAYDGASTDDETTGFSSTTGAAVTIEYYKDTDKLNTAPTDAGDYTAKVTVGGKTAQKAFKISKASLTVAQFDFTAPESESLTYDGNGKTATVTFNNNGGKLSGVGNVAVKYQKSGESTWSETAPKDAGTYKVAISVEEGQNYTAADNLKDDTWTFTVEKADGSGSVSINGWTYGSEKSEPVPASETNGTDNVTYKYKVSTAADSTYTDTKPTDAGDYTVKAAFAATKNYEEATATADFTISKATPTASEIDVTTPTSPTYSGTAKTANAAPASGVAGLGNLTVKYYNKYGSEVAAPINVGEYSVKVFAAEGDNYTAADALTDDSWKFTITKATLTVTAKGKSIAYGDPAANNGVEYEGFVNGETASVLGGTLAYAYKVSGTAADYTTSSPVGNYDIIPSGLTSNNYEIAFVKGTLTVGAKAIDKPTENETSFTYTGNKQTYTPANFDESTMNISGNTQTNANETGYTVTVTPKDNYVWSTEGECTFTWVIAKAGLTATASSHEVAYGADVPSYTVSYTGWVKDAEEPTTAAVLTSTYTSTSNVGTYDVTFSTEPVFANYAVTTAKGTVTVERAKTAAEPTAATGLVYTGEAQNGYTNAGTHVTLSEVSSATNVGNYQFKATPDANYAWSDGTTDAKTYDWSIGKAQAVITVDQTPIVKTYGEAIVLPEATSNFGEVACDTTAASLVNVGSYTVTYSVVGTTNYEGDTKTVSVTINPLAVNEPCVAGTYTYTGKEQTATVTGKEAYMTETGDVKGTDAGDYTITYALDENHCWADGSDGKVSWSIGKADVVKDVNITAPSIPVSELVYTGEALELLCAGVTYDEKDGISPCGTFYYSVDGENWSTDLPTAINAGKYNPVWYFVGDKNHNNIGSADEPITQLYPIEISKGSQTSATVAMDDYTYGGTLPEPSISITPSENATVTYYYSATDTTTGGTEWKNMTATTLDAGTYYLYAVIAATDNFSSQTTEAAAFTVAKAKAAAPAVGVGYTIDYEKETITPEDGYEVSTGSDENFATNKLSGEAAIVFGTTYYVRKAEDDNHNASEETPYTPERHMAPAETAFTITAETVENKKDGTLSGITETMEYSINDGEWISGPKMLTGLSNEAVKVRYKAVTDTAFHSKEQTISFTPSTAKLTVTVNGETYASVVYGEKITAPATPEAPANSTFGGWYSDAEFTQAWNFAADTVKDSMTLYDKWIENTVQKAAIGGNVKENDMNVSDAAVELYLGTVKVAATVTDTNGNYSFDDVENGTYNIVVTGSNGKTKTELVTVNATGNFTKDVELPAQAVSSFVEVQPAETDRGKSDFSKTVVGGLDEIAKNTAVSGNDNIAIKLTVVPKDDENTEAQQAIKAEAGNGKKVEFLDMSLLMQVNAEDPTDIGDDNTQLLTIVIPFDFTGVDVSSVMIIRKHGDGPATKLTTAPNADGEYFTVDRQAGTITLYAMKFSDYALAYEEEQDDPYIPYIPVTPTYTITGAGTENGKLTVSRKTASAGQTVTITVTPDEGYKLNTLTVKDAKGNALTLTKVNDTTYTFKMPSGKVTVSATFKEIVDSTVCPQDATCVYAKFTDADTKAWYHPGVHFCVENGYMQGVSATAFDPSGTTTRAMIVTMLWRMEDEPVANYAMSFKDVKADQWYTEAIRWAQSTSIVEGYSADSFGPNDPITREQMATILYRYAKYHSIDVTNTNTLAGYTDVNKVSTWALDAMKWANAVGLVQGRTTTTLVPEVSITRAEAATMVQRYCENFVK